MKQSLDSGKFLKELKKYKAQQKLTYEGLAVKTGVHRITLHRWLSGASKPRYKAMCKVTKLLRFRLRGLAPKIRVSVGQFVEPVDFTTLEAVAHTMLTEEQPVVSEFLDHVLLKLFYVLHEYAQDAELSLFNLSLIFDKVPDAGGGILLSGTASPWELCIGLQTVDSRVFWCIRKLEGPDMAVVAEGSLTERGVTKLLRIIRELIKGIN